MKRKNVCVHFEYHQLCNSHFPRIGVHNILLKKNKSSLCRAAKENLPIVTSAICTNNDCRRDVETGNLLSSLVVFLFLSLDHDAHAFPDRFYVYVIVGDVASFPVAIASSFPSFGSWLLRLNDFNAHNEWMKRVLYISIVSAEKEREKIRFRYGSLGISMYNWCELCFAAGRMISFFFILNIELQEN